MDYYKKVLTDYGVFSGRARRKEYWMFVLYNALISAAISIVAGMLFRESIRDVVSGLYTLFALIPCLAVAIRRLHDTGRSGWWMLLALIPILGAIVLLIFMVLDSQPGPNKYGANPKGQ